MMLEGGGVDMVGQPYAICRAAGRLGGTVRSLLAPLALCLGLATLSCHSSSDDAAATPAPATVDRAAEARRLLSGPDWYRHAVFYEVYVRSFQDSNGDGIGDLKGLTSRLDELKSLGVDALWLMPIMPTPFRDSGYDIADYRGINPDYGTLADFDELLAEAKKRDMRVMIDLVLNHTSDQHPWFTDSRSSKTSEHADWYVWSDTPSPPDNPCHTQNPSFGDSAWELDPTRQQYYFHRFYAAQPDLNYRNPAVVKETLDVARFWLDRGVDGFRCDVIALLFESDKGCDMIDETKDYIRQLRAVVDSYPNRALVAESTDFNDASAYFGNGKDMFHMAFNFAFGYSWGFLFGSNSAKGIYKVFSTVDSNYPAGAQDALLIGSHDVPRAHVETQDNPWRARRAAEISMLMRGTPYIYYGEELSLLSSPGMVVDARDAARGPMPWTRGGNHGFTDGSTPWLPFGPDADATSVEAESADASSSLAFYRGLLALRRGHEVWGTGAVRLLPADLDTAFVFARENTEEAYLIAISISDEAQSLRAPDAFAAGESAGDRVWGDGSVTAEGTTAVIQLPASGSVVIKLR
jgi:alpha-glucosidase